MMIASKMRKRRRTPKPKPDPEPFYVRVEGPYPADVWADSERVWSGKPDGYGMCRVHILRHPSGGIYEQAALVLGWSFTPIVVVNACGITNLENSDGDEAGVQARKR